MTKILLEVSYQNFNKYWHETYTKNTFFKVDETKIHQEIKRILEEVDYVMLAKNPKPISNVFVDDKDGNSKAIGYLYKVKSEIDKKQIYFYAWVSIYKIEDFPIKELL